MKNVYAYWGVYPDFLKVGQFTVSKRDEARQWCLDNCKNKFISSDLCFIITPKDPINFPIDLKFYHMIFNEFKNDIVKNTKAGTSKEAIN